MHRIQSINNGFTQVHRIDNYTKAMKMGILSIVKDNVATIHSNPNFTLGADL